METTLIRRAAPSHGTVVMQQMRLLWLSRRALLPLLGLIVSFVALEAMAARVSGFTWSLAEGDVLAIALITGGGWGLLAWRDEGPSKRGYHWGMPVDTAVHDLLRVVAGAVLLLAALVLFCVLAAFAAALRGGDPALAAAGPAVWLLYLTGPLTLYLLGSVLGVAVDRPFEWAILLYVAFLAVAMVGTAMEVRIIEWGLRALGEGSAGLGAALTGGLRLGGAGSADLLAWFAASLLWLGIAAAAVCGVAAWRRGR